MSKRTVVKQQLQSTYLKQIRELRIFLPPEYDAFLDYPVIYCQDGEDFFNFGRIATFAYEGILNQGFEPMIIVGVDVDKQVRTEEYAPDGSLHEAYMKFFAYELVPFIDRTYATRPHREERVLAGDSLGGTVSMHLALAYPALFGKVIALSGAFFQPTQARIQQSKDLSDLSMYMLVGLDETAVRTDRGTFDFVASNRSTKRLLEEKGVQLKYREEPGRHIWGFWQTYVPDALAAFF